MRRPKTGQAEADAVDLGIAGRQALIMGASRGIGRACALGLAREGCAVTLVARDPDRLGASAEAIARETGAMVTPVVGDITTEAGRTAALAACPQPDILLNNAGGRGPADFRSHTRSEWIAALDLMMLSPIEMIRLTFDGMVARGFGRIVNIASRSVKIAQGELSLSNGARSGLVGFCAGIAREGIAHGVTVNTLLPGIIDSEAQRAHVAALAARTGEDAGALWQARAASNPARRYGRPEEVAAYFAFLASAHAGYITGQALLIDGGHYPGTL